MNKWEVSMIALKNGKIQYKVTRRISELLVSETKMFNDKKQALEQFDEWLK